MEPLKTTGIVLRTVQTGSSRVLTVLTPSLGKISIWARGVRSSKNPMYAGCAVLCYSEFILLPRRDMYSLTGCSLLQSFYHLREDVVKLSYAAYFAELARIVTSEGVDASSLLRILLNTLYYLEEGKKDARDLKMLYELRLLSTVGFMPCTTQCILCGAEDAPFFSTARGGLVCKNCGGNGHALSAAARSVLHGYVHQPLRKALDLDATPVLPELSAPVESFLRHQIEMEPKSLEYLNRIRNILG